MEENFLRRWSRLKRALPEAKAPAATIPDVPAAAAQAAPRLPLPAVDSLDLSSDFLPFMNGEVAEELRRAALQKLFAAEHFNVMDGLDVYVDDYNKFEPIGAEMLQQLMQARSLLEGDLPEAAAADAAETSPGKGDLAQPAIAAAADAAHE